MLQRFLKQKRIKDNSCVYRNIETALKFEYFLMDQSVRKARINSDLTLK